MRNRIRLPAVGIVALCAALAGGCGGGGGGIAAQTPLVQSAQRGAMAVKLQFAPKPPKRTASAKSGGSRKPVTRETYAGNIPYGTLSVRVTVVNPTTGATLAPPRIITAPADVSGLKPLINVQYASLPVGPVRVDVAAFPNDNVSEQANDDHPTERE